MYRSTVDCLSKGYLGRKLSDERRFELTNGAWEDFSRRDLVSMLLGRCKMAHFYIASVSLLIQRNDGKLWHMICEKQVIKGVLASVEVKFIFLT